MPDTPDKSAASGGALPSSFNKTLSALTGAKTLSTGGGAGLALGGKLGTSSAAGGNGPVTATSSAAPGPTPSGGSGGGGLFGGGGGGMGGLLGVTSALQQQSSASTTPPPQQHSSGTGNSSADTVVHNASSTQTVTLTTPVNNAVPHLRQSASGAPAATADDVITVTETLIDAIGRGDYDTWKKMTSHDLTCFEPESQGCLIEGREFHKYYFDLGLNEKKTFRVNLIAPRVHLLGPDAGVIGYVLLTQFTDPKTGLPHARQCEESRVWRRDRDGLWRCVHFHRSSYTHTSPANSSSPFIAVQL